MSTMKTAISLERSLFEAADHLAEEMHISRSKLVSLAVEDYIRRHQNLKLLDRINQAYDDEDGEDDRVRGMRRHHRSVVANDPS